VTAVSDYAIGMPVPAGGVVLSAHGTARSWLQTNAAVGTAVTLPAGLSGVAPAVTSSAPPATVRAVTTSTVALGWAAPTVQDGTITSYRLGWQTTSAAATVKSWSGLYTAPAAPFVFSNLVPNTTYQVWIEAVNSAGRTGARTTLTTQTAAVVPAPAPAPAPAGTVTVGAQASPVNGVDIARAADQLVIYTRANGQTVSPANQWGFEVAVLNGKVTAVSDYAIGMPVPAGGVVLSHTAPPAAGCRPTPPSARPSPCRPGSAEWRLR
jgi:hypothetical protein